MERGTEWRKVQPGIRNCECGASHSDRAPWFVCLLLGVGAGFYDAVGEKLLKSPESGDKAAGCVAKGLGKVINTAHKFYCQY